MHVAISGALGRMGCECVRVFTEEKMDIALCVDRRYAENSAPQFRDFAAVPKEIACDVVVDFSSPDMLDSLLTFCTERKIPAVLATTGFSAGQTDRIAQAATVIPILASRNMSVGVNLLGRLCKMLCTALSPHCDIEIVETHHAAKRDAPSGTALYLADLLCEITNGEYVYDRRSRDKRTATEIGIHSLRGGSVVGKHEVSFFTKGETLTLTHNAENRELFARGACTAAKFLLGKPPRLYTMDDLTEEILH